MDSKLIEAVARALCITAGELPDTATPYNQHVDFLWQHYRGSARTAILAFLDAVAGDEVVVDMVAKDIFYATMPEDGSPVVGNDHRATAFKAARAALAALKGEVKP